MTQRRRVAPCRTVNRMRERVMARKTSQPPEAAHPHLTDEQFAEMLSLAGKSDSIELKLTVPEDSYSATARALGMDPLEARIRQIFFFDTPELTLNHAGLVVRARRIQGANDDSTVKMRPVDPREMPKSVRKAMK